MSIQGVTTSDSITSVAADDADGSSTVHSQTDGTTTDAEAITSAIGGENRIEVFGEYAGFVTRLVAFVVDVLIVIASIAVITGVADLLNRVLGFSEFTSMLLNLMVGLTSLVFLQVYWILFWMLAGQTPGKRLMGLRIIKADGGRVTIGACVRRLVGYYLSAFLMMGFLWVLFDNRRQGFHDKLAGTLVLYAWSYDKNLERGQSAMNIVQHRTRRHTRQQSQSG